MILPNAAKKRMVLKVLSDAWEMLHDRNCQALQFGFLPETVVAAARELLGRS